MGGCCWLCSGPHDLTRPVLRCPQDVALWGSQYKTKSSEEWNSVQLRDFGASQAWGEESSWNKFKYTITAGQTGGTPLPSAEDDCTFSCHLTWERKVIQSRFIYSSDFRVTSLPSAQTDGWLGATSSPAGWGLCPTSFLLPNPGVSPHMEAEGRPEQLRREVVFCLETTLFV